ncbi:DUF4369 domain-containing protein, partial [Fulvivirga sp. RKSG066]|uniref:DUF4369 domain-containing protein n=1 Tax=Fulvivirga aurantia TaxID=2529383 RepID=UPI0012BBF321
MKTIIKLPLLFILCFTVCCTQEYNVEAEISGIGNDTVYVENYLLSSIDTDPILDTVYAEGGRFFYNMPVKEPMISYITPKTAEYTRLNNSVYRPGHKAITLILEADDKVKVSGSLQPNTLNYSVKGSEISEAYSNHRNKFLDFEIAKTKIELSLDSLMHRNAGNEAISALFKKRKSISADIRAEQMNFVKQNNDSQLSAFYISRQPL